MSDAPTELATRTDYAWDWFAYHAGQRLTTFNFFLVIVGVLTVGLVKPSLIVRSVLASRLGASV